MSRLDPNPRLLGTAEPTPQADSTTATTPPLLAIDRLAVSFIQHAGGLRRQRVDVVTDMSVSLPAGEVVALVGASGAGKTLLCNAVLGMLPANARESGTVSFRGREIDSTQRRAIAGREMVLLPQSLTYLDPTARVRAQVRRSATLARHRDPRGAAATALAQRGLDAADARKYPHELSGGMGRRVLGAMASLGDPDVVLADEPTPGLHPDSVRATLQGLRDLADRGSAVLLVTHDLLGAVEVADRVVVCDRGRTIEDAPVSAFSADGSQLREPFSRALWRALPSNGFEAGDSTTAMLDSC